MPRASLRVMRKCRPGDAPTHDDCGAIIMQMTKSEWHCQIVAFDRSVSGVANDGEV